MSDSDDCILDTGEIQNESNRYTKTRFNFRNNSNTQTTTNMNSNSSNNTHTHVGDGRAKYQSLHGKTDWWAKHLYQLHGSV